MSSLLVGHRYYHRNLLKPEYCVFPQNILILKCELNDPRIVEILMGWIRSGQPGEEIAV